MSSGNSSRSSLVIVGCCILFFGFGLGWRASRRLTVPATTETQKAYLQGKGDAPDPVRAAVLESLQEFQQGYSKRDPQQIERFMQRLFPQDQDTHLIGTDTGEWRNGYDAITQFIRADWSGWGDLRLAVDESAISSSGDVAWLATTGSVAWGQTSRPIRFTAILTRHDRRWLFRQIQFQWDERLMTLSDLTKRKAWSQ